MSKIMDFGKFQTVNESVPFKQDNGLVSKIDYTLLSPSATEDEILELCKKADKLGVKSVCVLPKMVSVAYEALAASKVLVCTVVSFPHGTDTTEQKLAETKGCISAGADEVDMVLDYPELKNVGSNYEFGLEEDNDVRMEHLVDDVKTLVDECHKHNKILKVIVESGLLDAKETDLATHICLDAGADFIKTSTGMVAVGAELDKVNIMRDIINKDNSSMKIKASGGIRTMSDLQKFEPLVDRFGVGFGSVDSIFGGEKGTDVGY